MKYKFGKSSRARLETCHEDLQILAEESLKRSEVDFSINEGYRTLKRQNQLFKKGYSKIDGIKRKGKHNMNPSHAFDIKIYVPRKPKLLYDPEHLTYVAGIIMATSKFLIDSDLIGWEIRWGGNWNRNGLLLRDQSLWDRPHFELYKKI